ncbi:MAG: PilT/PilU family type 4a pilus ATPase [Proteobacteria bacterium]|nr:PilT/PilU family type 4a pilus ATPase [Pseudomonadota bacterium]
MAMDAEFEGWLKELAGPGGSDLYVTVNAPPAWRGDTGFKNLREKPLTTDEITRVIKSFMGEKQYKEFDTTGEFNMATVMEGVGRFRLNLFKQRGMPGLVARIIRSKIPTLADLKLPALLGDMVMEKRGLIFMVGGTGSGKSTSLAAMIGHRNETAPGHIITIEDPVEFVHDHKKCIVTQREVGVDTDSFDAALKNTLRQHPDMILIGEIRDMKTMEHALNIAETGHLAMATLHANNANQAIERVVNLFPNEMHHQILLNLSLNLRGIISQRLVPKVGGGRTAALEIMLNQGYVKELIAKGEVKDIKKIMEESVHLGMQTFDQALLNLFKSGQVTEETAIAEADNAGDLKMKIKQEQIASGGKSGLKDLDTSALKLG